MDRIDLHIEVPRLSYEDISQQDRAESSREVKKRVEQARAIQRQRFATVNKNGRRTHSSKTITCNADMGPQEIRLYCQLTRDAKSLLKSAFNSLNLSGRAYDRIVKVSRTIADLDGSDLITDSHVAESLQYRALRLELPQS